MNYYFHGPPCHQSDDESGSDSSNERRSRHRKRMSSPDSDGKRESKNITVTEEDITEYLTKKAHKKAMSVAKKLKTTDSNPFVWRKKIERDVSDGVALDEYSLQAEKKKQDSRMAEIEKAKKRRDERVRENARREEETMSLRRERSRADACDLEKKEEQFNFDQIKIKSRIRILQGRPKPIDLLTNYLDEFDIELDEPCVVFKGLTGKGMEELHDDIKLHLYFDRSTPTRVLYWEALMVLCVSEERGLHSSIETDVSNVLEGKTREELDALQTHIESQMRSGKAKVAEFWEAVLNRLRIYKAKASLKEIHAYMLARWRLSHFRDTTEAIHPDKDMAIKPIMEKKRFASLASKLEEGDAVFEVNLDSQTYWWHDKYRPRKPKYLNRVHTGYEWNKYNRTHYDHDNPPPKFVHGYKFNIFYPDLANKIKAPNYLIEKDGDSPETCIIRFHAGPPYEDIAFRIVNKEWNYSHKNGYKCNFEGGILRVYFNFMRHRYRR